MNLDWFDGGQSHVKSATSSCVFSIGDRVKPSRDYLKLARKGYFGDNALQECNVATVMGFEHDSGSPYIGATTYAVVRDDEGHLFHRHERWITKCGIG